MNISLLSVVIVSFLALSQTLISGQTPPQNLYRSASGRIRSQQETEALRRAYSHQKRVEAELYGTPNRSSTKVGRSPAEIERERERKRVMDLLVGPTESERVEYKVVLGGRNTGIFTLLNWDHCRKDTQKGDAVKDLCVYWLPGGGGRYSFRKRDYVNFYHADVGLHDGWFIGFGLATQTIMVDLGNIPISEVEVDRSDLRYLTEFVPATSLDLVAKQQDTLEGGVARDGRQFFNAVKAAVGHTYVMRSIAYRGKSIVAVNLGNEKVQFDRLRDDRREDVIIAFQVLRIGEDGRTRILWRKLQSKLSPPLDLPVTEIDGSQVRRKVTIVN